MEANNKIVLLTGPVFGIFRTVAEVSDSPIDPENKIFRFRDGCVWRAGGNPINKISIWSHWSEDEVGHCEGSYRVCRKMDAEPGSIAVLEGTAKPKHVAPVEQPVSDAVLRCEDAIMKALDAEPRMTVYALKRKIHAERFGKELWATCLKSLADVGEIRLEAERGLTTREQMWVCRASAPEIASSAPASAPANDAGFGADLYIEKEES